MTQSGGQGPTAPRTPWHLWVVGALALLWYAAGAVTIQLAQLGKLPGLRPDEIAYYAAKPAGLVVLTALGTYGSLLGAILLLLRHRGAVSILVIALACILLADAVELADGTSRAYANSGAAIVTVAVAVIGVGMVMYARAMSSRRVLA